ncbi:MAG: (2Fe-2S)-binding protein [Treponema sp.]|jgi:predicted molibdopterin-dependent oxidoreductase YjgC|nr:(2Fe-2S)-binding protein [Treponema sp.]
MNMRITHHPTLGDLETRRDITIYFDGKPVTAREEEPVAAALMSAGIRVFRKTKKRGENRGVFCAIGRCTDCMMVVDGVPNVRTCITPVREGMRVETQFGYGVKPEARE